MQTTITFSDGDQVTSAKLNEIPSGMTFDSGDIAGTTLSVVGGQLKVGTITAAEMGALSVATGSLQNLSVTSGKIALGAVGSSQLANLSVGEAQLANGSIVITKINSSLTANQSGMEDEYNATFVLPSVAKYSPSAAKAYGEFNITGTGRTIKNNSYNIDSLTRVSATQTTVTLDENMSSENYTVIASGISDGTEQVEATVYDKLAGNFKIRHTTEGAGRAINFTVYGKHA